MDASSILMASVLAAACSPLLGQTSDSSSGQQRVQAQGASGPVERLKITWAKGRTPPSGYSPYYENQLREVTVSGGASAKENVCLLLKISIPGVENTPSSEFEIFFPVTGQISTFPSQLLNMAAIAASGDGWPIGVYEASIRIHATTEEGTKRGGAISNTLVDQLRRNRSNVSDLMPGRNVPRKKMTVATNGNIVIE